MEKFFRRTAPNVEIAPVQMAAPRPEHVIEKPSIAKESAQEKKDREKINIVKERLLEAGGMTIEPLTGDPFVLSRGHESAGKGVTIYKPDGTIEKRTFEEDNAIRARETRAARFFSPKPHEQKKPMLRQLATRGIRWLKGILGKSWSKLKHWSKSVGV